MSAENKEIVRRVVDEIWNQKKFDLIAELYHPDYRNIDPGSPMVTDLNSFPGYVESLLTSFPDLHVDIEDMIAEGDSVAKIWKLHATFKADFMGIPANNKPVSLSGITVYRLAGGKIKECIWGYDNLGMMQQLGAIPTEASAAP